MNTLNKTNLDKIISIKNDFEVRTPFKSVYGFSCTCVQYLFRMWKKGDTYVAETLAVDGWGKVAPLGDYRMSSDGSVEDLDGYAWGIGEIFPYGAPDEFKNRVLEIAALINK